VLDAADTNASIETSFAKDSTDTTGNARSGDDVDCSHPMGDEDVLRSNTKLRCSGNPMSPSGKLMTSSTRTSMTPNLPSIFMI
jgi:uncharacterized Zn-binding protein involved in type VI secretion